MARRASKSVNLRPRKSPSKSKKRTIIGAPPEPEWEDMDDASEEDVRMWKAHAFNWYAAYGDKPKLRKNLFTWMKKSKYKESEIKAVKAIPDKTLTITPFSCATMLLAGMPDSESTWLRRQLDSYIDIGKGYIKEKKAEEKADSKTYKPTIQERMKEQLDDIMGEFESWEDMIILGQDGLPNIFEWLKERKVAQQHIGKIKAFYKERYDELVEAQGKNIDSDLKEAFAHLKKKDFKKYTDFYENMFTDLDAYEQTKKTARKTRARKAPSKDKLVAKMKYKKDDTTYKISSINPTDIVGAEVLWVFNCKTRKLGKYVVDSNAGTLTVKGTSIIGFDEQKSICKTIRKPEDILPGFAKLGKVKLRKLMDEIKAVEVKLTGRINTDTVLLKVQ